MIDRRLMRRYAAVLHHRRAGFSANAMAVWNVPEERSVAVGQQMAEHPAVTHCYERPRYDDWRFSHFTMIHAVTRDECEEIARQALRPKRSWPIINSCTAISEYKKTRVRYFVDDNVDVERAAALIGP